jgi:hypothetical protein
MANVDAPRGFVPAGHKGGGTVRTAEYRIAYNYGTALFRGDAVILSSGKVAKCADDSSAILGVLAGVEYTNDAGDYVKSPYWPGVALSSSSAVVKALVYVDPQILYEVQTDTGTAYVDATHVGGSYDIEIDHAGSTTTGQSGMEIDLGDTGTGQWTVYQLVDRPDNAAGTNAKVLVFNNVPVMG